jgi:hypothetical protein
MLVTAAQLDHLAELAIVQAPRPFDSRLPTCFIGLVSIAECLRPGQPPVFVRLFSPRRSCGGVEEKLTNLWNSSLDGALDLVGEPLEFGDAHGVAHRHA